MKRLEVISCVERAGVNFEKLHPPAVVQPSPIRSVLCKKKAPKELQIMNLLGAVFGAWDWII